MALPYGDHRPEIDQSVTLSERSLASIDQAQWDQFALAADGSFLGSWRVIRAERFLRRVRVFELFGTSSAGVPRKVAQGAVAMARGRVRFLDRLHLLPSQSHLWDRCLHQIVERCGPATYVYGSQWNHETRRAPSSVHALTTGCRPDAPFCIDRVDFAGWTDFAAYRRSVSENIRRDYKKAAAAAPAVVTRRGLAAWRDVLDLVNLRRFVMRRNQEPFSSLIDGPRHALKLMCMGDDAFIATVEAQGRRHAAFFGVCFGDNIYYLGGGTEDRSQGFGSYLFMTLLEEWFATRPAGKLYLGAQLAGVDPQTHTQGNLLYRRKLRATAVEGTAFSFTIG